MTDVQAYMWVILLMEFFIMGLWIGGSLAQRDNPNEPKPKNWDDKLHKEWAKGFRAGEQSTIKRMGSKLRDEELLAEYNSRFKKGE
jgi:hypothetical protein